MKLLLCLNMIAFIPTNYKLHNPCDFEVLVVFQSQITAHVIIDNLALSCLNVWDNIAFRYYL
jgi:hypothetical protein